MGKVGASVLGLRVLVFFGILCLVCVWVGLLISNFCKAELEVGFRRLIVLTLLTWVWIVCLGFVIACRF